MVYVLAILRGPSHISSAIDLMHDSLVVIRASCALILQVASFDDYILVYLFLSCDSIYDSFVFYSIDVFF